VVVSVNIEEVPVVEKAERYELKELGNGFYVVSLRFGFFEQPDVASVLSSIPFLFGKIEPNKTSFFLGRESLVLIPNHKGGMPMWQKKIYRFMSQNAAEASAFFGLPINRVVEVGLQVGL
jgi:KUP system potassium uptake protein